MEQLDRQTRKLMTMHNALRPKSNVDRLYLPRKDGGRGLLGVEDTVNIAKVSLKGYVSNSTEKLLSSLATIEGGEVIESETGLKRRKRTERKEKLERKNTTRTIPEANRGDRWRRKVALAKARKCEERDRIFNPCSTRASSQYKCDQSEN